MLYAFVRTADDLVDIKQQKKQEFEEFKRRYKSSLKKSWDEKKEKITKKEKNDINIIRKFIELQKEEGFDQRWADAFISSMESDFKKYKYSTLKELEDYMYGSAGVIGLMLSRIMKLPKDWDEEAVLLGNAMQLINFIRDVKEDNELGRQYLPQRIISKYGLKSLERKEAMKNKEGFKKALREMISIYETWNKRAMKKVEMFPKRFRVPIKTASEMYLWTAQQIKKDPLKVFKKKIKPGKPRVIITGITNMIR